MSVLSRVLRSFAANKSGTTAIEYGLICSLIVLAVLVGIQAVAGGTTAMYNLIFAAMS